MNKELERLINNAEAIVIGTGAGLSAAAGFEYGGQYFKDNFYYMYKKYGYKDMYSAGFHNFYTLEDFWGYWAKFIFLERYENKDAKPLYRNLFEKIKEKKYFIITTNVDHQFQKAGFNKDRIFYMQGDYGLFQCSTPCHQKTYDNEEMIMKMLALTNNKTHKIPSALIPKCPVCGEPMTTNLRCDNSFVQDEGWYKAKANYEKFINQNKRKKILYLELGVGYMTPGWIKYPFLKLTYENKDAKYVSISLGYNSVPDEIRDQSLIINGNIEDYIY